VALYNGNGFFPFSSSARQTLPAKKIAQEMEKKMEFSGGDGKCVDRVKYVLPDDKMKNCDIDKCDINGKTLGEFKSLPRQIPTSFLAGRKNEFRFRGLRLH